MVNYSEESESKDFSQKPQCSNCANGWPIWKKHVLAELERMDLAIRDLVRELTQTRLETTALVVRVGAIVGVFAAVATAVATTIVLKVLVR